MEKVVESVVANCSAHASAQISGYVYQWTEEIVSVVTSAMINEDHGAVVKNMIYEISERFRASVAQSLDNYVSSSIAELWSKLPNESDPGSTEGAGRIIRGLQAVILSEVDAAVGSHNVAVFRAVDTRVEELMHDMVVYQLAAITNDNVETMLELLGLDEIEIPPTCTVPVVAAVCDKFDWEAPEPESRYHDYLSSLLQQTSGGYRIELVDTRGVADWRLDTDIWGKGVSYRGSADLVILLRTSAEQRAVQDVGFARLAVNVVTPDEDQQEAHSRAVATLVALDQVSVFTNAVVLTDLADHWKFFWLSMCPEPRVLSRDIVTLHLDSVGQGIQTLYEFLDGADELTHARSQCPCGFSFSDHVTEYSEMQMAAIALGDDLFSRNEAGGDSWGNSALLRRGAVHSCRLRRK